MEWVDDDFHHKKWILQIIRYFFFGFWLSVQIFLQRRLTWIFGWNFFPSSKNWTSRDKAKWGQSKFYRSLSIFEDTYRRFGLNYRLINVNIWARQRLQSTSSAYQLEKSENHYEEKRISLRIQIESSRKRIDSHLNLFNPLEPNTPTAFNFPPDKQFHFHVFHENSQRKQAESAIRFDSCTKSIFAKSSELWINYLTGISVHE